MNPNPFNDQIEITSNRTGKDVLLEISDVTGRMILQSELDQPLTIIPSAEFGKGVYFVKISQGQFPKTIKMIKAD